MSKKKKGIDISVWQGNINAGQIKNSGIDFVIIREGYRQAVDSKFFNNVKKCKEVGLAVMGVYHFSYALNAEQAKQEAQLTVANLEKAGLSKDTIVFFDFEYDTVKKAAAVGVTLGKAECNAHTKAFCETVESLGYRAGVYFNIDYYHNWYDHTLLDQYVKWLADWTGETDYPCDFHQYTSKGSVSGISGNVDMNYYFVPEIKENVIEAGNVKPAVVTEKSIDELANEVLQGAWGNGDAQKNAITAAGYDYTAVQKRANELCGKNSMKSVDEIAKEVINGAWGNGEARKTALEQAGYNYGEVQKMVNILVKTTKSSIDAIAMEVIAGKWGNGEDRKNRLNQAGYDFVAVQKRVNELM